jgi:Transposase
MPAVTCRFFVGIDWGTETHHVCVLNVDAQIVEERRVQHTASDIAEFFDWLSGLAPDFSASMAIAIELPHGTLVEELLESASFASSPSTRNSSIVSVTAIFPPARRMTGGMLLCSPMPCGLISIASAWFVLVIRPSSVCAS